MGPSDTATFCATVVDEWCRAGLDAAFVAPGSRSTPLALALAADERVAVHVFHDERSASFAALGHGLATGRPAAVLCTSGTAATHFHAAVVEADLSSVPLLVCTADRPPELWGVGAPQTIDQTHLYGRAVRFFAEPGPPDASTAPSWRSLASRAVAEAVGWSDRPGPVHLNLSFRDPLVGSPGPLPEGRPDGRPWHEATTPPAGSTGGGLDRLVGLLHDGTAAVDGAIVAGAGTPDPAAVDRLAETLGWPVIADHRSGCRGGPNAVRYADALLRSSTFGDHRCDVVLRFGETLASKALSQWLTRTRPAIAAVFDRTRWSDPERDASIVVEGAATAAALAERLPPGLQPSTAIDRWRRADARAAEAIDTVLAEAATAEGPTPEIGVAVATVDAVPAGGVLVVSSSMPVRDVEWFGPLRRDLDVLANRGANGIDGVISTAVGVALAGRPTTVLIGDVAFLHDSTALVALADRPVELTIVVIDNDGGGIFSFLPQATELDHGVYELLFGSPHGTDLAALARAHRLTVDRWPASPSPGPGPRVVIAHSDRATNVDLHQRLERAVIEAVDVTAGEAR